MLQECEYTEVHTSTLHDTCEGENFLQFFSLPTREISRVISRQKPREHCCDSTTVSWFGLVLLVHSSI